MDLREEMRRMRWKWRCVGCWRSKIPEREKEKLQNNLEDLGGNWHWVLVAPVLQ